MVNDLQARLHSLYNARQPVGSVHGQTVGQKRYKLIASGEQLYTLLEAADRIAVLEAALREIADFSEQFIGDDEDGDERMYKVNQIADTALAGSPPSDTTQDRGGAA